MDNEYEREQLEFNKQIVEHLRETAIPQALLLKTLISILPDDLQQALLANLKALSEVPGSQQSFLKAFQIASESVSGTPVSGKELAALKLVYGGKKDPTSS